MFRKKLPTAYPKSLLTNPRLPIVRVAQGQKAPPVRTQARSATILPNFVGLVFQVHNGKIYHDVEITEDMVGHKLGEFSPYAHLLIHEDNNMATKIK